MVLLRRLQSTNKQPRAHNGAMRSAAALLLFLSAAASAEEILGPAEYLAILAESKLHYNIVSEPSRTPAEELNCARRDQMLRVVADGAQKKLVMWTVKPEALKLLNEGETLFEAKDYDAAGEKYHAATVADPQAVSGYFYYGDALLFGGKNAAAALEQYEKAIALDPTLPTGHLFASTALTRLGRRDEAREQIIKALVYYPGYEAVWKIAAANPGNWNARDVVRHMFQPPRGYLGAAGKNGVDIYAGEDGAWLGYAMCKAVWANEPRFAKRHAKNGWSLEEERACVLNQLMSRTNAAESAKAAASPLEQHLLEVTKANLLEGYILFEIIGQHCPLSLAVLSEDVLQQMEAYIRRYVIVGR